MAQLVNEYAALIANEQVGPRLYVMRLRAPELAKRLLPGQFVHMRVPGMADHILRRPFSVYAWEGDTIDILYQTVGFGSAHMAALDQAYLEKVGDIELIGPVGNTWVPSKDFEGEPAEADVTADAPRSISRALVVAGGAGSPAVFMLTKTLLEAGAHVEVVMGAQTKEALVCRERFEKLIGKPVLAATDDGTFGRAGFCTSLVDEELAKCTDEGAPLYDYVATCGPAPLMRLVAFAAEKAGVYCEVSMERRMACGIGACLSCVVDTTDGKRRACVDGPIFDARKVVW